MIEYKGYTGNFEFDEDRSLFYGKVSDIEDLVTFQGKSVEQVKEAFKDAVNEYMAWCKKHRTPSNKTHPSFDRKARGGGL